MDPQNSSWQAFINGLAQTSMEDIGIMAIAVFSLIGFFGALILYIRSQNSHKNFLSNSSELTGGLRGKIEKIEMNLNNARTEFVRADQFVAAELIHLRKEILAIRQKLEMSGAEGKTTLASPPVTAAEDLTANPIADDQKKNVDSDSQRTEPQVETQVPRDRLAESFNTELQPLETESSEPEPVIAAVEDSDSEISVPAVDAPKPIVSASLFERLGISRRGIFSRLKEVFRDRTELDEAALDEVEELLISADIGIKASSEMIKEARSQILNGQSVTKAVLLEQLRKKISDLLASDNQVEGRINLRTKEVKPCVILMIGVNGVGKTTTTAKLASRWQKEGLKVMLAAADTFRAAAVDQLVSWGTRIDIPVVTGPEGAKPATVVFDALDKSIQGGYDVLLIDTAGRLHNKANLMQELKGIENVVQKKLGRGPDETILVVDAATGQNALTQAREFNSVVPLSGLIVTKLDGTPKGGVVVAIKAELGIPISYIGVGEAEDDLRPFNANEFASALLSENQGKEESVASGL